MGWATVLCQQINTQMCVGHFFPSNTMRRQWRMFFFLLQSLSFQNGDLKDQNVIQILQGNLLSRTYQEKVWEKKFKILSVSSNLHKTSGRWLFHWFLRILLFSHLLSFVCLQYISICLHESFPVCPILWNHFQDSCIFLPIPIFGAFAY